MEKHTMYSDMDQNGTEAKRSFPYLCTCGDWRFDVTYEAFNVARGNIPWSTPRSVERAFQTHLRESAVSARLKES
jgi:hypothetical protein